MNINWQNFAPISFLKPPLLLVLSISVYAQQEISTFSRLKVSTVLV